MGLETLTASDANTFDVFIIGGGPAGLAAAIYARKANLKTAFIEKNIPGGKIVNLPQITNYPGFKSISGADLALNFYTHATELGAKYIFGEVAGIKRTERYHTIFTTGGVNYFAKALIIATGTKELKLNIPGEDKYANKGVSYCVLCDGSLTKDKNVALVGSDENVINDVIFLAKFAKNVFLVNKLPSLNVNEELKQKLIEYKNIEVLNSFNCKEIKGDGEKLNELLISNGNKEKSLSVDFVFVSVGHLIENSYLSSFKEIIRTDGTVDVDEQRKTKIKGVFAAGDIIHGLQHQIVISVNDGAIAAINAIKFVATEWK